MPLWDEDLKYRKIIGYVHLESRTLFDAKHRFSQPMKQGAGLVPMPEPDPAHQRRIELATPLWEAFQEGQESQS